MESKSIRLSELNFGVIINTSSGGCDSGSEAQLLSILEGAGVTKCKTWCGQANQMEQAFAEAAAQQLEALIVLGGDGTIRTAAGACSRRGIYLLPLPGGTMNMLPRALYGEESWENALKNTLAHPVTKVLSGGRVENNQFFVAAIAGVPALWAETRESIREGDIVDAIKTGAVAFQGMFSTRIQYSISSETKGEAEVIAVICPLISQQMSESEQALEAAVISLENATELIRFATAAAVGKWRDGGNITLNKTTRVTLQSSTDIPIFLDGERVKLGNKAEISFVPKAVSVIVPAERIS
jgi:diacylglycerol kinase family enzyme